MLARLFVVAVLVAASASTASAQAVSAVAVTSCGQVVPAHTVGVLQDDLDCPAAAGAAFAVTLEDRAVLELDGHRLSGGGTTVRLASDGGSRRWTIRGPGEISGGASPAAESACVEMPAGLLIISDVVVRSCASGLHGVIEPGAALQRQSRVRATRLLVEDGVGTTPFALHAFRIDGRNVTVRGNAGAGIRAHEVRGTDIRATDNGATGLHVEGRANVRRLVATGNGDLGVRAGRFLLLDQSTVTGNDGSPGGVDIASDAKPLLRRTTCGRSARAGGDNVSFGVCVND